MVEEMSRAKIPMTLGYSKSKLKDMGTIYGKSVRLPMNILFYDEVNKHDDSVDYEAFGKWLAASRRAR